MEQELQKAREEIDYLKSVLAKVTIELAIVSAEKRQLEQKNYFKSAGVVLMP